MSPKTLDAVLAVDEQIGPGELSLLKDKGFRAVINCRPDGEEAGQPSSDEIARAAAQAGLAYVHVPVMPGGIGEEDVAAFGQALETLPQPIFGYCKTGTRAAMLWGLCRCGKEGPEAVLETARQAGYDLSSLRARLADRAG